MARQWRASLFTTSITQAEIYLGIQLLPAGRRRDGLSAAVQAIFDQDFAGRVLAFDGDAAGAYAEISAQRRQAGRPISQADAMIAALARSRGATLATRLRDFDACGIALVDPWAT